MKSFKLFGLYRTRLPDGQEFGVLCPVKGFFKLHSRATIGKKDKKWVQKDSRNIGVWPFEKV